jgi:hypothetical protein
MSVKDDFKGKLQGLVASLSTHVATQDGQWTIKGFIDTYKNIYTISADTKIISKIIEIHLFPKILQFAEENNYKIVLADYQNYYPDISFVSKTNDKIKFAVDYKTTYRNPDNPLLCNGFTLGSHGEYFIDRSSTKNIQFPYKDYLGHYCLGIIYDRIGAANVDETHIYQLDELQSIVSVAKNFELFIAEKWKIASDKGGSGNTANIGSITNIDDIKNERGMFSKLGEKWFDDYWINYNKISFVDTDGQTKTIRSLHDFVAYRKGDVNLIVPKRGGNE